ncbi:hypothetical protein MSIBF_A2050007 [groundwater metagenome]|uniref:Uncharacterized protein n=1 Tax=groundwater metagenome TaxID=717931 RepID=A0A098E9N7_9ZZZZ
MTKGKKHAEEVANYLNEKNIKILSVCRIIKGCILNISNS